MQVSQSQALTIYQVVRRMRWIPAPLTCSPLLSLPFSIDTVRKLYIISCQIIPYYTISFFHFIINSHPRPFQFGGQLLPSFLLFFAIQVCSGIVIVDFYKCPSELLSSSEYSIRLPNQTTNHSFNITSFVFQFSSFK